MVVPECTHKVTTLYGDPMEVDQLAQARLDATYQQFSGDYTISFTPLKGMMDKPVDGFWARSVGYIRVFKKSTGWLVSTEFINRAMTEQEIENLMRPREAKKHKKQATKKEDESEESTAE